MIPDLKSREVHSGVASTPSTTSTHDPAVEAVEGVEVAPKKSKYEWKKQASHDRTFREVGSLLASLVPQIYRHPDGGLLVVEDDLPRRISSAKELAPFLIDHIRIFVRKKGEIHGERPSNSILSDMLMSQNFLGNFKAVNEVATTPVVLPDRTLSRPGYNQGGILHLGPAVAPAGDMAAMSRFLDVMAWQSDADRTNAVAAALTVPFRLHFPGGKPLVLLTATKSHAGKTTLGDYIQGGVAKADILYENIDWPMQRSLQDQLRSQPETGVISFDNVRKDSAGPAKIIRSAFLESFVTSDKIALSSAASKTPVRMSNKFVVILNTNEGALSIDLLNRSLPIRLAPTGGVTELLAKSPIGNPRDFLRNNRRRIEAELWGMIERWRRAGSPLDEGVRSYPMSEWAATIGGILMFNGFKDFLANYGATRTTADPLREALGVLAFAAGDVFRRAGDLAEIVKAQGLRKALLPGAEPSNEPACERAMGKTLSPYVGETFTATIAAEVIVYRLKKQQGRFGGQSPHFRYAFEEVSRVPVTDDASGGLVLEDPSGKSSDDRDLSDDADLSEYEPEVLAT